MRLLCIVVALCCFIPACGKKNDKKTVVKRLGEICNDATRLWNEVIVQIDHYSGDGKSSTGSALDIDFVIENMDQYFEKVLEDKEYVDGLGEEYSDLIQAFDKLCEKAEIIRTYLKEKTPEPSQPLSYADEIDLFHQYYEYFYDGVYELKRENK